jgi:hypothetical protein
MCQTTAGAKPAASGSAAKIEVSLLDSDVYGGPQYAPLFSLAIPDWRRQRRAAPSCTAPPLPLKIGITGRAAWPKEETP